MTQLVLSAPAFAFIVGTRAALAAGVGLAVSDKLSDAPRRAIGMALIVIGAITTIPAAISVARAFRRSNRHELPSTVNRDEELIGATRFPRKGDDDML